MLLLVSTSRGSVVEEGRNTFLVSLRQNYIVGRMVVFLWGPSKKVRFIIPIEKAQCLSGFRIKNLDPPQPSTPSQKKKEKMQYFY